jgi:ParB family chromosome partitioning protein
MSVMTKEPQKRGLGRGLAALLGDDAQLAPTAPAGAPMTGASGRDAPPIAARSGTTTLPIAWLKAGRFQPRTAFDPARISELADSIRAHGLVQPILVRPVPGEPDRYEIVAGERRWRAAQEAQLHDVPVVVRSLEDGQALEIALIENLQRAGLSPIEEARGYRRLLDEFRNTQEHLAETIGKSRSHVTNMLRLLELPAPVQALIEQGRLDMGHARALIGTPDPAFLADIIVSNGYSVRTAEQLAAAAKDAARAGWDGRGLPPHWTQPSPDTGPSGGRRRRTSSDAAGGSQSSSGTTKTKSAETRALERSLEESLGLKVSIDVTGPREQAQLTIWTENFDQLDDVVERLTRKR